MMLVLTVLLIVAIFTAETPSTEAEDFPADFADVVDDEVTYLIGQAIQIAVGVLVAFLGATLYVGFRGRERYMSLIGFTGFLMMGVLFVASGALYVTTHALAQDLEREETIADAEAVQEIGRMLVSAGDGLFFLSLIGFALGLIAFGSVILSGRAVSADAESIAMPPSWVGWIATAAGVLYIVGWLSVFTEWLFVAVIIAFVLTIIWYLSFGNLLLRGRPAAAPEVSTST
jgi:hypothetical protein